MNRTRATRLLGSAVLLLTAAIWGVGFFAQDWIGDAVSPFFVTFFRFLLAGLLLIPVIVVCDRVRGGGRRLFSVREGKFRLDVTKTEWLGGVLCGVALCVAANFQQLGIAHETGDTSTATFISALYVIFVPIFRLFLRRRPHANVWIGAAVALVGFYFMTAHFDDGIRDFGSLFTGRLVPVPGDLWVLACAVVFAVHIIVIDHFAPESDPIRLSCIQFLTTGVISFFPALFMGALPAPSQVVGVIFPLLYLGAGSGCMAYTLQIVGQKYADPAVSSVILSLESVFGVLSMMLFAGEYKTPIAYVGCGLVFLAVLITQFPHRETAAKYRREKKK